MDTEPSKFKVAEIGRGRWWWWPNLQTVELVEKGKQRAKYTISLPIGKNNLPGAILAAVKYEFESRRAGRTP